MKPCRSPYCECSRDQCSHPHFYDARHLPFQQHSMPIKSTHQIAYDYCQALISQRALDNRLDQALQCINPDNQVFGLADAVEGPYTKLVQELLGDTLFEWLMWWIYETEHGTQNMEFIVNDISYDPTQMTLYRFLEIIDANA